MKYKYNGHLTFEERIDEISQEILSDYPNFSKEEAKKISILEPIINDSEYNPKNEFRRLYNILFILKDKNNPTYKTVLQNIKKVYEKFFYNKNNCIETDAMNLILENKDLTLDIFYTN